MQTHYALSFAMLWGYALHEYCINGNHKANILAGMDPDEFDALMFTWADEFLQTGDIDSEAWFDEHLAAWLLNQTAN